MASASRIQEQGHALILESLRLLTLYSLVIDEGWLDGAGQPLKAAYRQEFSAGKPIEAALEQGQWEISPPAAGTRNPLVVKFPRPLDHALLQRALGVRRDDVDLPGESAIDSGERRWLFTPRDPWKAGEHQLMALTLLEDPAGNRLGRAFEVRRETAPAEEAVYRKFNVGLTAQR